MRNCLLSGILLAAFTCSHAEETSSELHVNPFLRPEPAPAATHAKETRSNTVMEVRGVVLAGQHSLANIGGKIVSIGQEINGYQLVEVRENNVVLDRDGLRRELAVRTREGTGYEGQDGNAH